MYRYLFLFVLVIVPSFLFAQEFGTLETNPFSLKWQQINTNHFKVIFPKGFEQQAQRMANTLDAIHAPESKSLGASPSKISIVLQNQSSISNAFVTITPRRSEFYTMPTQNYNFLGNNDWLDLLASHEYRHIVQFQQAKRGINRLGYYFFGNNVLSAMSYVSVPQWFWEGDAVATETAFTTGGRGRIPNFDVVFRMNLQEGRTFHYDKQYLRSFRHNIPNHYVLGYHLVSHMRQRTQDAQVWERITARTWNWSLIPFRFSSSVKKETGLYLKDFYQSMAKDLQASYQKQLDSLSLTSFERIHSRKSTAYTDYEFPQEMDGGSILAMKSGIGDIETLVTIKNGVEKKIFVPGFINESGMLSAVNSRVVWNEYRNDPRWRVRTYSVLVAYDLDTKIRRVISKHSRYAGAALSPDGYQVAAIETDQQYKTRLVVLDFFTGKILFQVEAPDQDYLSMPRWTADGKEIIVLRTGTKGKAIASIRLTDGTITNLTDYESENKGHPIPVGDFVLYNSPISGIDNIYAFNRTTGERFQVTCSQYGAYNPSLSRDGKTIFYNEQTKDGLDIVKIPFDPSHWKKWSITSDVFATARLLTEQEGHADLFQNIPQQKFPVKPYSRWKGIFNPYSWGAYFDNTLAQADIGISSRDVLGTTSINAGYQYDINERTGFWKAGVSFQSFYPIIDFQYTSGKREEEASIFNRDIKFTWKEEGVIAGLRVPLLYASSKYQTLLEVSNAVGAVKTSNFENELRDGNGTVLSTGNSRFVLANDTLIYGFNDRVVGNLMYNRFIVSFANVMKRSRRDFNSPWAQYLTLEHYGTGYNSDYQGSLTALRGVLYFPGLIKHHSLFFRGGYQQALESSDLDVYSFRNRIFKPRGHSFPRDSKFVSFSSNYQLPIWYPDIAIGPLVNVQRIKANLFYDYGSGEGRSYFYRQVSPTQTRVYFSNNSDVFQSMGAELTFDINVIRLLPVIEVGLRASYLQANKFTNSGWVYEFMLANIPF